MIRDVLHQSLAAGLDLAAALAPTGAPKTGDDSQFELKKLHGSWVLVYWLYDGHELRQEGGRVVLSVIDEHFTFRVQEKIIEKGTFESLDAKRSPKTLVYAPSESEGKPFVHKFPAIYFLENDVFLCCVGYRGKPQGFSAGAGSANELVFYKRISH